MRKRHIAGCFAGVAAVALLITGLLWPDIEITIDEQTANQKITSFLPYEKELSIDVAGTPHNADVTIKSTNITFYDNGLIGLYTTFLFKKGDSFVEGSATGRAAIEFVKSEGAFYLDNVHFDELVIDDKKLADTEKADIESGMAGVKNALKQKWSSFKSAGETILSDDTSAKVAMAGKALLNDAKKHIEKNLPDYTAVAKRKSKHFMTWSLSQVPIYTLDDKDLKQKVASMALKDIVVKQGQATVVLSIASFIGEMLLFAFAAIMGLIMAIAFLTGAGGGSSSLML